MEVESLQLSETSGPFEAFTAMIDSTPDSEEEEEGEREEEEDGEERIINSA